jgi:uncharacterized protein YodC (DUF2158 family)
MSTPFNPGDTVTLRSGGVAMVVDEMKPDGVRCTWVDATGEDRAALFAPRCLSLVVHREVIIEAGLYRYVWVFADTGFPIAEHILTAVPVARGEA